MMKLYGLPNCDTTKKKMKALKAEQTDFDFVDIRVDGLDKKALTTWMDKLGFEKLLNKKSTTWRNLDAAAQQQLTDNASAVELILQHPTLLKRPVVVDGQRVTIG
jgi:arsenate reductase (glutaredoxin)